MAEVVADLLERQPLSDKMGRAGVTQRVRPLTRALNAQGAHAWRHQVVQTACDQRPQRSLDREEQAAQRAARPNLLHVAKDRVADVGGQRVVLLAALLRAR